MQRRWGSPPAVWRVTRARLKVKVVEVVEVAEELEAMAMGAGVGEAVR
jgi:hypothetical protein